MWRQGYLSHQRGESFYGGLPGASPASLNICLVAGLGGLIIVGLETWGESALNISAEQSEITVLFGLYKLVAAIIEEIIFRGYLVPNERRGRWIRWEAIIGASVVFAALHPFLWSWEDSEWEWTFTTKGWFSTAAVFVSSLWFYTVRFLPGNPHRSLLPCFVAHASKNLAVFAVKAAQGFVVARW
ncbi:MAG: CPBP family intramembrane metalloprotease [Candidatus Synoicihabitans palmerolidicus]|nr:CPBP family intramembrane metalloprotease [Candidatus Synoicihabitans palmerolidicus]